MLIQGFWSSCLQVVFFLILTSFFSISLLSLTTNTTTGHSIRTSLIPEAALWYTGEAIEDDDEDEDDEVC